jgi:histone acetyltransferase (RNA polymerase elongator complex component)
MIVPVFLPHFGCKTRCIYCNQNYITNEASYGNITNQLVRLFNHVDHPVEVALYGGNPFGLDVNILNDLFELFEPFADRIVGFRLSAKPGPVSTALITVLKSNNVQTIELGVPSVNNSILRSLNRGHTVEEAISTYLLLSREGFEMGIQLMVGLPKETHYDLIDSIDLVRNCKPSYVRIYPLLVIQDTPLYDLFVRGEFYPDPLETAVRKASLIYASCWKSNIRVIKMGLTENDILKENVIAGPFHPAFGYIVKSEVFRNALEEKCLSVGSKGPVTVHLNPNDVAHLVGLRRTNIEKFAQQGILVKWSSNSELTTGHFILEVHGIKIAGDLSDSIPKFLS